MKRQNKQKKHREYNEHGPWGKYGKCGRYGRIACLAAAGVLTAWTLWGNRALMVSEFTVSGERIPEAFSGFRIVQISDLHNAVFGDGNALLLRKLAETEPDMIVITGDLVDSRRPDVETALKFVAEAIKLAPVYYVTGNHEAALSEYADLRTGLKAAGAVVLKDEAVTLERDGEKLLLMGLHDPDFTLKGDIFGEVPAMAGTKLKLLAEGKTGYKILLSHRPELFEIYAASGIDLIFSGHAHGGQFRLPLVGGLIAPNQGFFPKYDAGLYTKDSTNMVVSRGIGNSIIPIRFNNRPEIVVVTLLRRSSHEIGSYPLFG